MNKKIVVIGAGISGLSAAFFLKQKGFDITVFEKRGIAGGTIETQHENGFIFDCGPSYLIESSQIISKMIDDLGLDDQIIYASKSAVKRYIVRKNRLHELPMKPSVLIKSNLLSIKAKLRLFAEPLIRRSSEGFYLSVAEFITRRLGREFLDYIINPLAGSVYAGNPESLSVKSSFPKLYQLEENFGGLVWGTYKSLKERKKSSENKKLSSRILSFRDGLSAFPKSMAKFLGKNLLLNCEVKKIEKDDDRYLITFLSDGRNTLLHADAIISSVPAYTASELFSNFDEKLKNHLTEISYAPVLVLFLAYKKESVKRHLDAFDILIPAKERKSFLSAICASQIFPSRSISNTISFTLFVGGTRDTEILTLDKEYLFMKVRGEFETLLGITDEPVYTAYKFWPKAIPQYSIGYIEHENYIGYFEKKFPGIFLIGSYHNGISIGDCIKNAQNAAEAAASFFS